MQATADAQVGRWAVVVPVKRLAVAKTRLSVLGDAARRGLALAFAADVVVAASAAPAVHAVVVVTDDCDVGHALGVLGAHVVPDRPGAGIDAALEHGATAARTLVRGAGVAAVAGDLPALTAAALGQALGQVRARGVVADASGTGTTLLATTGGRLAPSFGPGSLARHLASGAQLLDASPHLRRDVDTPDDLAEAVRLGVGPNTERILQPVRERPCSPGPGTMRW